jgi:hypothetical protein
MGTCKRRVIAMGLAAAAALSPPSLAWAAADTAMRLAAPSSQEETIYRPECRGDEISNGWLSCPIAEGRT